jgi:glycogen debranching enzyme
MKPHEYLYPFESLYTGSSLGNLFAFARLNARTDLLGLWSSSDNQYYVGEWTIRILSGGHPLQPRETLFSHTHQSTLSSDDTVEVEQSFCLPLSPDHGADPARERLAVYLLVLRNKGTRSVKLTIRHHLVFPGVLTDRFTKQPPEDQISKRVRVLEHDGYCSVTTEGRPEEVRVFGSALRWSTLGADATTLTAEMPVELQGGETRELTFHLAFSPNGIEEALRGLRAAPDGVTLHRQASDVMAETLSRAFLYTPNPLINRAMQWAKVNMVRVRHRYRTGQAFTNDPPQDIVVVRDLGWFVLGADYFLPEFSRRMLDWTVRFAIHDGGKLTEYLHADEEVPVRHDYHLNINDDTPLFVWGLIHHAMTCGDREFLSRNWSVVRGACDWILRQMVDGLVSCSTEGTSVWGICSWRNIIDDYTLSGAVTEINAECYLALRLAAGAAQVLGYTEDVRRFNSAADALRVEMNTRLRSEKTGLYMLNLDNNGRAHHDITGDLIFPVLTGVADAAMVETILARLVRHDVWTEHGIRTVAPSEPNFNPDSCYQLLGGVWPNLTAWVAYCLRASMPEKVAEAMVNIYRIAEVSRPVDWGFVVPGEFPERIHGMDFTSRGMTLSPWTPPTYLWLGIEGLLGVRCGWEDIEFNPALPPDWKWIAVKDLQVNGSWITAFLYGGVLYASHHLTSSHPVKVGELLKTEAVGTGFCTAGLLVDDEILLFAATDGPAEGVVRIEYKGVWQERRIALGAGDAALLRFPDLGR